jgi:hypothetical protein
MPNLLKLEYNFLFAVYAMSLVWLFIQVLVYKELSKLFFSSITAVFFVTGLIVAHMLVQQWRIKDTDAFGTFIVVFVGLLIMGIQFGYYSSTIKFPIRP